MDYFLSCQHFEPENYAEHYTEKVILFDRLMVVFSRPELPAEILTRAALGLPENEHLYCCPVMLFKLHSDMDRIFGEILDRDPKARILLFGSPNKVLWQATLEKRFAAHLRPDQCARITFLPFADKQRFFQILKNVDAVLDSFHFSFGTTSFLLLGANIPFVTWPGEFHRGRGACGMFNQMGMTDLIAPTHEAFVELALRLANGPTIAIAPSGNALASRPSSASSVASCGIPARRNCGYGRNFVARKKLCIGKHSCKLDYAYQNSLTPNYRNQERRFC